MTSATTESKIYGAVASDRTSPTFPSLPIEIVRLIFEASVTPVLRAGDEQPRQRTAYALCLVSKDVEAWVEPLLYEKVVLESLDQVMSFLGTLKIKPATFLARTVKTVWILEAQSFYDTSIEFPILFSKCPLLERFAFIDSWMNIQIPENIPKPQSGPYVLQELTIIKASAAAATELVLPHITLQRLQIINCSPTFLTAFFTRALGDKLLLDALRAIPQIYLDFIATPSLKTSSLIKSKAIPLWINPSPESISILHIRASSDTPAPGIHPLAAVMEVDRREEEFFSDVDSWIKYFDEDVQKCGGRLVVYTLSGANNPGASYIEQCTAWIGLN